MCISQQSSCSQGRAGQRWGPLTGWRVDWLLGALCNTTAVANIRSNPVLVLCCVVCCARRQRLLQPADVDLRRHVGAERAVWSHGGGAREGREQDSSNANKW